MGELAKTRRVYNRLSRWYDALSGASEGPLRDRGLEVLGVQGGERVLEIGPGTGHALSALAASVGPGGRVAGVELSGGMLAVATQRLAQTPEGECAGLVQGDGAWLPFRTGCFDAAFLSFTLELFDSERLGQVLTGCRRVLRASGRLCVVALGQGPGLPVHVYEAAHRLLPRWVDCRPIAAAPLLVASGFVLRSTERRAMWGLPVDIVVASSPEGGLSDGDR